jgi:type I restriction enzyme S subunit
VFADDVPLQKEFVFHALGGYLRAINEATPSVTVKHLSSKTVGDIPVPRPPLDEQRRIVERIDERHAAIDGADDSLGTAGRQLVALRSAVLQRAVAMGEEHALGDLLVGIEAGRSFRCHGYPASDGKWGVVKVSAMTWGNFREEENKEVIEESAVEMC